MKRQKNEKTKPQRKPVVMILVEGDSEVNAICNQILEFLDSINENVVPCVAMLDKQEVEYFDTIDGDIMERDRTGGDITSTSNVTPDNIEMEMSRLLISAALRKQKLKEKDVSCVIHIMDADGAFISEDRFQQVKSLTKLGRSNEYYCDCIKTININNLKNRNATKADNMHYLANLRELRIYHYTQAQLEALESHQLSRRMRNNIPTPDLVKSVPYHAFFFSCNLDHFLYDDPNLDSSEKTRRAYDFARKYPDLKDLVGFICRDGSGCTVDMTYTDSWRFLENGLESLKKHTNLNILFNMGYDDIMNNEQ